LQRVEDMFDKNGLTGNLSRIVLYGLGLGSITSAVYVAGPFVEIGGWRPLDNYIIREALVAILCAAFAGFTGFSFWKRKSSATALAKDIAETREDDSAVLAERMTEALETLKGAAKGGATYLYDLPWYVIIGPPGSGKTTAIENSGVKFPLSSDGRLKEIKGVGGTRYCDWLFAEDAVFIDTAGRYTTQDSDATLDKSSWFAFLDLLKKHRPRQPINGVIVAISVEDILLLPADDLAAHARAIRARLLELHDRLKIDFPVYAIFTKADLIAGFTEFFADLDREKLRSVFGATFQTADKKSNLVAEVPREFDALIEWLNQTMVDRLQDEANPENRARLYGFPAQIAALKRPAHEFLTTVFDPTRYRVSANLRGFYFTSGTQEGAPIDQLLKALNETFSVSETRGVRLSGLGKSFFLYDLVEKVIIGEAAWVTTDVGAVRRALMFKSAGFALIALCVVGAGVALGKSYALNAALIGEDDAQVREYGAAPGFVETRKDIVDDRDFSKILPLLQKLREGPTGYARRDETSAFLEGLGLGQRPRLVAASVAAYRLALERLLRPRLLYRLEETLGERRNDPAYVYEALKVYMMLGHATRQQTDRELVLSFMRQDWRDNLMRGPLADEAKQLEDHLAAMLDLDTGEALVEPNQALIEDCQKTLARLKPAERAYQLLKSQARNLKLVDWSAQKAGGILFDQLFEEAGGKGLETIRVPGFFTYDGFRIGFLKRLGGVAQRMKQERWVLARSGEEDAATDQRQSLGEGLLALYARDFDAAWREALGKLKLKRLNGDKPQYKTLGAATASNSPLKLLVESVHDETAVTKERRSKPDEAGKDAGGGAVVISELFPNLGDRAPGDEIEKRFAAFHVATDGSGARREIDELLAELNDIKDNLTQAAAAPETAPQSNAALATLAKKFRGTADRMPEPFRAMLTAAADSLVKDLNDYELRRLSETFGEQVATLCQQVAPGRFPFVESASNEIALGDFGRLFGVNGVFDSFFKQYLAKYVDASKAQWSYRPEYPITARLSVASLREFQRAAQIREAFFATGGTQPNLSVMIYPPALSGPGVTAKFEMNGQVVSTISGVVASPQPVQWPGAGGGRTAVTFSIDAPSSQSLPLPEGFQTSAPSAPSAPIMVDSHGAWSFFRLLRGARRAYVGDRLTASFSMGRQTLTYGFQASSTLRPLSLPALSEFHCPGAL
jgi:type VI secretion system protein ImpL